MSLRTGSLSSFQRGRMWQNASLERGSSATSVEAGGGSPLAVPRLGAPTCVQYHVVHGYQAVPFGLRQPGALRRVTVEGVVSFGQELMQKHFIAGPLFMDEDAVNLYMP